MDHVKEMVSRYARVNVVRIVAIQNGSGHVLTLRITGAWTFSIVPYSIAMVFNLFFLGGGFRVPPLPPM
jgi:hypothetical protein